MLAEIAGNRDVLHPNFVHDFLCLLPRFSITQSSKFKEMKTNRAQIQYQGMKSEAQKWCLHISFQMASIYSSRL